MAPSGPPAGAIAYIYAFIARRRYRVVLKRRKTTSGFFIRFIFSKTTRWKKRVDEKGWLADRGANVFPPRKENISRVKKKNLAVMFYTSLKTTAYNAALTKKLSTNFTTRIHVNDTRFRTVFEKNILLYFRDDNLFLLPAFKNTTFNRFVFVISAGRIRRTRTKRKTKKKRANFPSFHHDRRLKTSDSKEMWLIIFDIFIPYRRCRDVAYVAGKISNFIRKPRTLLLFSVTNAAYILLDYTKSSKIIFLFSHFGRRVSKPKTKKKRRNAFEFTSSPFGE